MKIKFNIKRLEAFLSSSLHEQVLEKYVKELDLSHINSMQRRRLSKSARFLFSALKEFDTKDIPMIFNSYCGEINRCFDLLNALSKEEAISPTSFSLSVHNACLSQYAIFSKNKAQISALSSCNTLENALIAGYLKLDSGFKNVLVISHFEGAMSDFLKEDLTYILVLLLEKGDNFTLEGFGTNSHKQTPHSSLEFLKHFEKKTKSWSIEDKNLIWKYTS